MYFWRKHFTDDTAIAINFILVIKQIMRLKVMWRSFLRIALCRQSNRSTYEFNYLSQNLTQNRFPKVAKYIKKMYRSSESATLE